MHDEQPEPQTPKPAGMTVETFAKRLAAELAKLESIDPIDPSTPYDVISYIRQCVERAAEVLP